METVTIRLVDAFPEPAYAALSAEAFLDYKQSELLSGALIDESKVNAHSGAPDGSGALLRLAAFRNDTLVGWSYSRCDDGRTLHMINAGVTTVARRRGVYSQLVQRVIEHAVAQRYTVILSRHAAGNNAVIVAKLKLGFVVSGFEYSEVYGPLVRLTYLVGEKRRALYEARSRPIRSVEK